MESMSDLLRLTTTPDEASRPEPTPCRKCGVLVEATWRPPFGGRWEAGDLCDRCRSEHRQQWERQEQARRDAEARDAGRRLLESAGVYGKQHMTFAAFEPATDSQRLAFEAVWNTRSVWLWGNPGAGKTHLAVAAVLADAVSSRWWLVPDLIATLREGVADGSLERHIERCRSVKLLVLDDLGVERPTEFVTEQLYRIIDERYDRRAELATIVTSNLPPSRLAATLGARIHSRLLGCCEVIHVEGPDGRLRGEKL